MMKMIFINLSERSSVTKMSQKPYSRSRGKKRESAMSTVVTCHHCNKAGYKVRDCKLVARKVVIDK